MSAKIDHRELPFGGLAPGRTYRVYGYHTGDFIGRCVDVDNEIARFEVTDTLRPAPKVKEKCAYPSCVRGVEHGGDHEFPRVRLGGLVDVWWRSAGFELIPANDKVISFPVPAAQKSRRA